MPLHFSALPQNDSSPASRAIDTLAAEIKAGDPALRSVEAFAVPKAQVFPRQLNSILGGPLPPLLRLTVASPSA